MLSLLNPRTGVQFFNLIYNRLELMVSIAGNIPNTVLLVDFSLRDDRQATQLEKSECHVTFNR